ncbi:MAG TPA: choice-of-anchor tandem repeat NxxGxxAF-containing protein, partial [Chthoniobacteraceae bacterium]|nr:choice-of-anchor tandem repeat NxxGxxAF-containing protein [Chthoniobacteraceae bacterium]
MKLLVRFVCTLMLTISPSWAEVLYDLTFEAPQHEVGQRPSIGNGPSKISGIVFGSPRIVNDQPLLDGNCLEFEGYLGYEQIHLSTPGSNGTMTVDFDIVTKNVNPSLYGFTVFLDTPEVRSLTFHGPLDFIHAFMPFGGGMLQSFSDGQKYHVSMVADTQANSWKISINGVPRYQSPLNASSVSSIRLSMSPMYGGASDEPSAKAYVDNFKVVTVPLEGGKPIVTNLEATNITAQSATLNAKVNPQKAATTVTFVYTDPSGSSKSTIPQNIPAGTTTSQVSSQITVDPHQLYQYRVVATNLFGTTSLESKFMGGNSNPIAQLDELHCPSGGQPFSVNAKANDSDPDGDLTLIRLPQAGEEGYDPRAASDGTNIIFSPTAGFDGNVTLHYLLTDKYGGIGKGLVIVRNNPPVAPNYRMTLEKSSGFARFNVVPIDSDGDQVTIARLSDPAFGTVSFTGNSLTYNAGIEFTGRDEFTYTVADWRGGFATGRILVSRGYPVPEVLHLSGTPVPNAADETWKSFGSPSIFADGIKAGWLAKVKRAGGLYDGIFSGPIGAPELRFRTGRRAADEQGDPIRETVFTKLEQPVFAGENFAFSGRIAGPDVSMYNESGIWVSDAGKLKLIARQGFEAPGVDGAYIKQLESIAMPDADSVFFLARLWLGYSDVTAENDRGLWAWHKDTGVSRVLHEGQVIEDGQQRLGRIESFRVISYVPGSAGHGRYDSSRQSVDALVRFNHGRSSVLTVDAKGQISVVHGPNNSVFVDAGMPSSPGEGRKPIALLTLPKSGKRGDRYQSI